MRITRIGTHSLNLLDRCSVKSSLLTCFEAVFNTVRVKIVQLYSEKYGCKSMVFGVVKKMGFE